VSDFFPEKIASVDGPEIEINIKCGIWRIEAVSRATTTKQLAAHCCIVNVLLSNITFLTFAVLLV